MEVLILLHKAYPWTQTYTQHTQTLDRHKNAHTLCCLNKSLQLLGMKGLFKLFLSFTFMIAWSFLLGGTHWESISQVQFLLIYSKLKVFLIVKSNWKFLLVPSAHIPDITCFVVVVCLFFYLCLVLFFCNSPLVIWWLISFGKIYSLKF